MTRSPSRAAVAGTAAMSASTRTQTVVRLGDLDIAPENLRHGEAADDGVHQLADTIAAAGLLQLPTVRPGRDDEAAYMVLDGRRRLLALRLLRDAGRISDDHGVEVFVENDRKRQAAAVVLANTAVPVHVADVVAAIGRMLKARLGVKAIAGALGYGEIEIRRLAALSALPPVALEALKAGRITLRQTRLLARLKDAKAQAEMAEAALAGQGLPEWRIQEQLGEGRITGRDPRCGLVTPDLYAAEGGRTEADLFGELPPVLLDPEALTRAWLKRATGIAAPLEAEGLTVRFDAGDPDAPDQGLAPDDLEPLYYAYGGLSDEETRVYRAARDQAQAAAEALASAMASPMDAPMEAPPAGGSESDATAQAGEISPTEGVDACLEVFLRARIAQDQAGAGQRLATVLMLRPSLRTGLEVDCYGPVEVRAEPGASVEGEAGEEDAGEAAFRPQAASHAYEPPCAPAPVPEVEGVSHVLHATRTDTATRGLIRALADAPEAALIVLAARLFASLAVWPPVGRTEAALAVTASVFNPSGGRVIDVLDGAVRERLEARRHAWEASGLTMIAWVRGMEDADRLGLLAELTALSLDLREERTSLVRTAARTEAAEIAGLCDADISHWWTPDGAYLRPHSREQLLTMLERMGAETEAAARLKKGDLVAWTEDQARARAWAPACLSWRLDPEEPAARAAGASEADRDGSPGEDDSNGAAEAAAGSGVGVFVVTSAGEAALDAADRVDADDAAA